MLHRETVLTESGIGTNARGPLDSKGLYCCTRDIWALTLVK